LPRSALFHFTLYSRSADFRRSRMTSISRLGVAIPRFEFFRNGVQDIDLGREPNRINRPVAAAAMILDPARWHPQSPERFCVGRRLAKLGGKQGDAKNAAHGRRKFPQVPAGRTDPDELFRLKFIHVGI